MIQALSFNLNKKAHINIIVHPHELIKYVHGGSRPLPHLTFMILMYGTTGKPSEQHKYLARTNKICLIIAHKLHKFTF